MYNATQIYVSRHSNSINIIYNIMHSQISALKEEKEVYISSYGIEFKNMLSFGVGVCIC